MARLTGKAGAAIINSLTWILDGWEYEETSNNIEIPAAGDTWTERVHLRSDWSATIRGYLSATPPYSNVQIPVGTEAAIVLKTLASDLNGLLSGNGLYTRGRITHEATGATRIEATVVNASGSAGLTLDTTPAT